MTKNIILKATRSKELLDSVSSSFCLAKWLQVTLHLQNGTNHSCHHPRLHKIPLELLKQNPSVLHNTPYKKEQRKKMLQGVRPEECSYCWNIEDSSEKSISDRIIKSSDDWAFPYASSIDKTDEEQNIIPTYLEVSFSNECNFKCAYCSPTISSAIYAEALQKGPIATHNPLYDIEHLKKEGMLPYKVNQTNPYVEAFWKWFPDISKKLNVFRITGGEPLLGSNTFKVLDYLIENPLPHINFSINSNLGIPQKKFELFLKKIKLIINNKHVKSFKLYTSVDTHGEQAEYLRYGMEYKLLMKRIGLYLEEVNSPVIIMTTFNILSIPQFDKLVLDIFLLRKQYDKNVDINNTDPENEFIYHDISYLQHPELFSVKIINHDLLDKLEKLYSFIYKNKRSLDCPYGISKMEEEKFKRMYYWAKYSCNKKDDENTMPFRKDFIIFFKEYDKRRNTDFLKTFPELESFYNFCESYMLKKSKQ